MARVVELAPAVRKVFEIRPSPEERSSWMSLTVHQLEALEALERDSLTMRELCVQLAITESAGTALSDRLIAREMVTREADPADRRVIRLALTDRAREIVGRFRELKSRRLAEVLSALDVDDLAALVRIYEEVAGRGQR